MAVAVLVGGVGVEFLCVPFCSNKGCKSSSFRSRARSSSSRRSIVDGSSGSLVAMVMVLVAIVAALVQQPQ